MVLAMITAYSVSAEQGPLERCLAARACILAFVRSVRHVTSTCPLWAPCDRLRHECTSRHSRLPYPLWARQSQLTGQELDQPGIVGCPL